MRALPVLDPGTPDVRSPGSFLFWLVRQQQSTVALGMLWGAAWMVAQALVPAAIGSAVDALIARNTGRFSADCAVVLGLGVITAATGLLRHRCVVGNFLDAAYRTIQLITEQASRLGDTLARLVSAGEVISIGTGDVEALGGAIDVSGRASGAVAALITTALVLLSRSAVLGLIVLIGAPALTALSGLVLRPLHHRQQRYRTKQGDLAARAADIVSGLRVLRGIGGEPAFSSRYRDESQHLRRAGVHVARAESYLTAAEVLLPGMFVTVATWLAAHYALRREITPGELVSFYAYASFLTLPLATLTEAADKVVRGHVAASRVVSLLSLRPDVTDPVRPRAEPAAGADLHDPVSGLTVRAGELLGVAADRPGAAAELADRLGRYGRNGTPGTSGAPGDGGPEHAADPAEYPRLGGVPLAELPVDRVRSRILVATGQAQLFDGPLADVLSAAAPGSRAGGAAGVAGAADDESVLAALRAASALDVLEALPGGLHGPVAARGTSLSGGQAQRLRLARALLAEPEILILVEPTSAVDAHTEARIAGRLGAARAGRTTVVVTSSPLLLDAADRVVFLRDGRVAAQGAHAELLATSPAYAEAVTRGEDG
jgi:ABC-type multidrug transport system fused ATPase/permease subunit